MKSEFSKGDAVIITDIHPRDGYFLQKDLLLSKKAFILAAPNPKWRRNKHMKGWLSIALNIDGEDRWFYGVKIEKDVELKIEDNDEVV